MKCSLGVSNFLWRDFSVQFSHSVMSDSLRSHAPQHARPPCPSPTPRVHPNSCPLSGWCHPAISSSVIPSPPAPNLSQQQGLFQGQLFTSGGQSMQIQLQRDPALLKKTLTLGKIEGRRRIWRIRFHHRPSGDVHVQSRLFCCWCLLWPASSLPTIWRCPCAESSFVLLVFAMTSKLSTDHLAMSMCAVVFCVAGVRYDQQALHRPSGDVHVRSRLLCCWCSLWPAGSLGKTLLAFAMLPFVLQGHTCLLFQVFLDFLLYFNLILKFSKSRKSKEY